MDETVETLESAVIHSITFVSATGSEAATNRWEVTLDVDLRQHTDTPEGFVATYKPGSVTFRGVSDLKIDADSMGGDPTFMLVHDVNVLQPTHLEPLETRSTYELNGDWFVITLLCSSVEITPRGEAVHVRQLGLTIDQRSTGS